MAVPEGAMKIVCLVKLVPDVDDFTYDYDRHVLVRDGVRQTINPEDAVAVAFALQVKEAAPETLVETITMGPSSATPHLADLVRRGVDRATLISDLRYVGSDTYVTSRILARAIERRRPDWIFSGTHSLDGGTAHVPPQIAEVLGIAQLSEVVDVGTEGFLAGRAVVDVDAETAIVRFAVDPPAVLSFQYTSRAKLPYIPYEKIDLDVSDRIEIVDNGTLGFDDGEVGLRGSLTKVVRAEVRKFERKDTVFVRCDDAGIETVYGFLKEKGFV